jgi:hypothetical protein
MLNHQDIGDADTQGAKSHIDSAKVAAISKYTDPKAPRANTQTGITKTADRITITRAVLTS